MQYLEGWTSRFVDTALVGVEDMRSVENMQLDQVPTRDLRELLVLEIWQWFQLIDILMPKIQLLQKCVEDGR